MLRSPSGFRWFDNPRFMARRPADGELAQIDFMKRR